MPSVTRKPYTWDALTPQSLGHTGDVVQVWDHADDRDYTGVFLGVVTRFGEAFAMIGDLDDTNQQYGWTLDEAVTIKLLRESVSFTRAGEDRLDARDPQPRWTWLEVVATVALFLALTALLALLQAWR